MNEQSFLSINQFSEITGLNVSTLRYYDQIGILEPASRGRNKYRYYAPYQLFTTNFINFLAELGVPLARIKELSSKRSPREVFDLLCECEQSLDLELKRIQNAYSKIHEFQRSILASENIDLCQFQLVQMKERAIILSPVNDWTKYADFYEPFVHFCKNLNENGNNHGYPVGGCFDSINAFQETPSQANRFFFADPNGKDKIKKGNYVVGHVRGYYADMGDMPERIIAYAEENNLNFAGSVYVTYLLNEVSLADRDNYLAQVMVEVC